MDSPKSLRLNIRLRRYLIYANLAILPRRVIDVRSVSDYRFVSGPCCDRLITIYLLEEKGSNYVLLSFITSDPIERRFGWYRQLGGANY